MIRKFFKKLLSSQGRADIRFFVSRAVANPLLRPMGFTLIADHFYQPIPNRAEAVLYADRKRPSGGCDFRYDDQLALIRYLLSTYKAEINSREDFCATGYQMEYGGFGSGDAEMLYCLIRHLKPGRIVEIGAGTSTQVMLAALRKNAIEGATTAALTSIDPFPSAEAVSAFRSGAKYVRHDLIAARVQDVPLSTYETLGENDILFVDSSHVFKSGSDVEHEFLNVYPSLRKGVWVHVHDIFLPFDYPAAWNNKQSFFWNEQYILEAFLQFNIAFEVRAALNMVGRRDPAVFLESISRYKQERTPGSFWMQRMA
jgi:predicted O-methyltransferase YrrM